MKVVLRRSFNGDIDNQVGFALVTPAGETVEIVDNIDNFIDLARRLGDKSTYCPNYCFNCIRDAVAFLDSHIGQTLELEVENARQD